jgi:class 3 adenylate cyclase
VGDGLFATFEGPARAVRCGRAIADAVKTLNIQTRAGVRTGECEVIGKKLGGIAVHIAARIMALAAPDEVLVSSTVRDLVVGSGRCFTNASSSKETMRSCDASARARVRLRNARHGSQ